MVRMPLCFSFCLVSLRHHSPEDRELIRSTGFSL